MYEQANVAGNGGSSGLGRRPFIARLALVAVAPLLGPAAFAAPGIHVIVPFGPGSGADALARHCAPALSAALGQPVEVRNVTGSTGITGIRQLLDAPADGGTLAVLTADTFATLAYTNPRFQMADVVPMAIMMRQPSMLFVAASSRFKTWQDFEKEARSRPRALRVAITGLGSPDYIQLQQLAARGIQLTPVPRDNPAERVRAIVHDLADAVYEQFGDLRSYVDGGQIRPILAFSTAPPPAGAPAVPTARDLGLGEGLPQFRAIVVRRGTAAEAVAKVTAALERIAMSTEFRDFLKLHHATGDSFLPGGAARASMESELERMRKIVRALPMHAQVLYDEEGAPQELPPQF